MTLELTDREQMLLKAAIKDCVTYLKSEIETWEDPALAEAVTPILAEYEALKSKIAGL